MKDLNLLVTLDALLETGSVTEAAEVLHLSPPAVSRALGRLRRDLGDPILVRSGRGMRPTPRALALRERVRALVVEADDLLRPADDVRPGRLDRTFTIRGSDDVPVSLGPALATTLLAEAPRVRLRFLPEGDERPSDLRDGLVDLDIGAPAERAPDLLTETLTVAHHVAVMAADHSLADGELTASALCGHPHVVVTRRGRAHGPLDVALAAEGLARVVAATVPSVAAALALARSGEVVAIVPDIAAPGAGLVARRLPVVVPAVPVAMSWHRRTDAEPAHRWLRERVRLAFDAAVRCPASDPLVHNEHPPSRNALHEHRVPFPPCSNKPRFERKEHDSMQTAYAQLDRLRDYAPLVIRVVIGGLFIYHGIDKFDTGITNVEGAFDGWGVPAPGLTAPLVAVVEIVAGAAFLLGIATRLAAIALALVLVGALVYVKADVGILGAAPPGAEVDLAYLAGLVSVLLTGPGPISLDEQLGVERDTTKRPLAGAPR